jgi:ferritin-like metal-binding protein YciE
MAETAKELFEHELRDIYDAEHKLINALEKMAKDASDDQLSHAFKEHRGVTQQQTRRLERVFELVDRTTAGAVRRNQWPDRGISEVQPGGRRVS